MTFKSLCGDLLFHFHLQQNMLNVYGNVGSDLLVMYAYRKTTKRRPKRHMNLVYGASKPLFLPFCGNCFTNLRLLYLFKSIYFLVKIRS